MLFVSVDPPPRLPQPKKSAPAPASGAGGSARKPAFNGIAIPDDRDRIKNMERDMLNEAERKRQAAAAAEASDRDRAARRYSRSRSRSPRRHRDDRRRSRSRSPRRHDDRRDRDHDRRGRSPPPAPPLLDKPDLFAVYKGRVSNVMEFGFFVELDGFRTKTEGLVHVSQMSAQRVTNAKDKVQRGQPVYVKVISNSGQRLSLAMRDVDQDTGEDLLPLRRPGRDDDRSNPAGPGGVGDRNAGLRGLSGIKASAEDLESDAPRRPGKRLTSPERWEAKQLIASGVLSVKDYPQYDEEGEGLLNVEEEAEEALEIDINDAEPDFLRGQTRNAGVDMSPVKIVPHPPSLRRPPAGSSPHAAP